MSGAVGTTGLEVRLEGKALDHPLAVSVTEGATLGWVSGLSVHREQRQHVDEDGTERSPTTRRAQTALHQVQWGGSVGAIEDGLGGDMANAERQLNGQGTSSRCGGHVGLFMTTGTASRR